MTSKSVHIYTDGRILTPNDVSGAGFQRLDEQEAHHAVMKTEADTSLNLVVLGQAKYFSVVATTQSKSDAPKTV